MQNSKYNEWPDFVNLNLKNPNSNSQKTLDRIFHMHKRKIDKTYFSFSGFGSRETNIQSKKVWYFSFPISGLSKIENRETRQIQF